MSSPALHRLLVVDDEPDLRTLYELTLLREGYDIDTAGTVEEAWQHLLERRYSAVITDMRLPDGIGLDLIRRLEAAGRPEKAIVITAYGSAENAVSALKAGAYDYLTKPVDLKQFRAVVASALSASTGHVATTTASSVITPPAEVPHGAPHGLPHNHQGNALTATPERGSLALSRLVGNSPAIQQVRVLIDKVARSMAPVLIWGESGTGKELVARAIHDVSSRASAPFMAVNCGAIPEQLLEAEFFGYRKGAFTGANEDREGFFQAASGGTLFLDEIGDLPLAMQTKLLRAIQERSVRAVGATQEVQVDVRVVSATHKDLQAEVQAGRFRQDLYYRLNVIQVSLPALRDRLDDLPVLSRRILDRIAAESGTSPAPHVSPAAQLALRQHRFPGNVRELENILHRAVALSNQAQLEPHDLGLADTTGTASPWPESRTAQPTEDITEPDTSVAARSTAPLPSDLVTHLDQVERDILIQALEKHRLNRTAAGASLGLSLRQIRYRMARLGVEVSDQGLVLGDRPAPEGEAEPD